MTTATAGTPGEGGAKRVRAGWGWALRRALLGIMILVVCVGGAAWLLYSSIDPVQEAQAAGVEPLETQTQMTSKSAVSGPNMQ